MWLILVRLAHHANTEFPEDTSPAERQGWVAMLPGLEESAARRSNSVTRHSALNAGMLIVCALAEPSCVVVRYRCSHA